MSGGPESPEARLWRRASDLFVDALEQEPGRREAFVRARAGEDGTLRDEVLGLLAAHEEEGILDGASGSVPEPDLRERVAAALADRYRILELLGEGGSAVVFLAWEKKHDRRVVLKVMRPEIAILQGSQRFLEEVRLASSLAHPHILALIDSGTADGLLYYVMPYVEGETLYERLERASPLGVDAALPLLRDVAEALAHAHGNGIVHRDLKPANVLCAGQHAYLMDFGVAKALRGAPDRAPRTRVGFVPGTPRYMAPEQIEARPDIGPAADVYAWGQLAHECLTGQLVSPPPSDTGEVRRRLASQCPEAPEPLRAAMAAALAVDPAARPSAEGIVRMLDPTARPVRGRRRVRASWAGATAVAAAAALFLLPLRGDPAADVEALGPLAVAEFRNETGDSTLDFLGRMAGDWITQGLQEVGTASVVPWPSALAASAHAKSEGAPDPAAAVAAETGARTVVSGAFYLVAGEVRFQTEIVDAAARRVLVALDPITASTDEPHAAVTELRDRVMGSIAILAGGGADGVPELANRAPTFQAYRAFDRALALYLGQSYDEATPAFLEAYALDSTFTTALLYAATTAWNSGARETTDSLVRVVEARRNRLSEYDGLRLRFLDTVLRNEGHEAIRVLRRSVEIAPESRAAYNLARLGVMTNRPAEAVEALRALDPDRGAMRGWAQYWTQLTHAHHLLGRHDAELAAAREMVRRHPERTVAPVLEARALAAAGRVAELDSVLEVGSLRPPHTYWSQGAALTVAGEELLAHHGSEAARPYLDRALAWVDARIAEAPAVEDHRYWRGCVLYDLERWDEALVQFEELLRADPTDTSVLGMAAVAAARLGDRPGAERYLEADRWGYEDSDRLIYEARVAAIFGEIDRALPLLTEGIDRGTPGFPWMHAAGHHDFALLRADPRIEAALAPR